MPFPLQNGDRRLRVVIVIRSYGFPEGMAATNRVRLLGRALLEHSVDVRVICMRVSEDSSDVRNRRVSGIADGIPFVYTPGSTVRSGSFVVRRLREATGYVRTLSLLRRLKQRGLLDCVFLADGGSERWYASVYVLLQWLDRLSVPVITELNEFPRMQTWLPGSLMGRLSHLSGARAAVTISSWLSEWAAAEARRIGRTVDVVEIPILVDVDEQEPSPYQAGDLFVYSASPAYKRDLAFVFRAMRHVWRRRPEARLMVTGMRAEDISVIIDGERVRTAVDDGRIRISGYVDRAVLLAAYREAAGLLIPLRDDVRSRARFPSKLGEYLASGRPVVTCLAGEVRRFLLDGATAYIATPDDVGAFADKIIDVLDDAAKAAAVGAAGRLAVEELFSYREQGGRFAGLLERVCRSAEESSAPERTDSYCALDSRP